MIKFLVDRPIAVFTITLALVVLGLVASYRIPTSLLPDIHVPEVSVQLTYPNSSAREIETNIVRNLRSRLIQISGVKDVLSESRDGSAILKLKFDYGVDTDFAFIQTNEKVDESLQYLPSDLKRPKVIRASASDIPVLNLTVSLKNQSSIERFLELSKFSETVIKKRIEQLPEVALADMSGYSSPLITIIPDRDKIRALGISSGDIVELIRENNLELGNLIIQQGILQYYFTFSNSLNTVEDIENIYMKSGDKLIQIKDVAKVSLVSEKDRGVVYVNGIRSIVFSVVKQADTRVYDLEKSLSELIQDFEKEYTDLSFKVNQDQTELLRLSINNLRSGLWIGCLLAIVSLFVFINDIKLPFIIGISIPLSLIVTLLAMFLLNHSINIISLSGLILGVGMMVDNSIIVIDNITQKQQSGLGLYWACIEGTKEIISPMISSVLSTCAVFLPLIFLSGITGSLFFDQALTVSISLGVSLLVSVLVVPVLYFQMKRKEFSFEKHLRLNFRTHNIEHLYAKGYEFFNGRKWLVFAVGGTGLLLATIFLKTMKYTELPEITQKEFVLSLDWNENISVEESHRRIAGIVNTIPEIELEYSQIGEQQFMLNRDNLKSISEASVYVKSRSAEQLDKIKKTVAHQMGQKFPKAVFSFLPPDSVFEYIFSTNGNPLTAEVYDLKSTEVPDERQLEAIGNYFNIHSEIPLKEEALVEIFSDKLLLYNVEYEDLLTELKSVFDRNFVDNLQFGHEMIPIRIGYENTDLDAALSDMFVRNTTGDFIPVTSLIGIHRSTSYKTIYSNKSGEYLPFDYEETSDIERRMEQTRSLFAENLDLGIRFSGNWFEIRELKREMIYVFTVALLLLYFIMAAQFESFWQPLIILIEIPIDLGGALLLLWAFGGTLNIMSAIGLVVMSGIVINDSILKIHTINMLIKEGLAIDAAIKEGGKKRLKPIIITSLTTVLPLIPLMFLSGLGAELQRPLALTLFGGLVLGTFISLYFIPLLYKLLYFNTKK